MALNPCQFAGLASPEPSRALDPFSTQCMFSDIGATDAQARAPLVIEYAWTLVKAVADLDGEKSELTGMDVWMQCNAFLLAVRLIKVSRDTLPPPSLRLCAPPILIYISKTTNRLETTPVQFICPEKDLFIGFSIPQSNITGAAL
jgi:hypothetical protein